MDWLGDMVAAVVIALGVMLKYAGAVSDFVHQHPTLKMLALAFLPLIGVTLVAEGRTSTSTRATSTSPWPSPSARRC